MTTAPAVAPERSLKWKCFSLKSQLKSRRAKAERGRWVGLTPFAAVARLAIIVIKQKACQLPMARDPEYARPSLQIRVSSEPGLEIVLPQGPPPAPQQPDRMQAAS